MSNTVGVVCIHYEPKNLPQTLRGLDRVRESVAAWPTVFVANHETAWVALNDTELRRGDRSELIRHDNSGMEFGAYQAGLDRLLREGEPDWVLFANDTFATHQSFGSVYRQKLAADLERRFDYPAIIGRVVSMPQSYQIEGMRAHRWVTTNLFAINRAALRALGGRIYRSELDALIIETSDMDSFFDPRIDPGLRKFLEVWLFRARPGWHWHASDPLQPANAAKMARKARSIIQERHLGALLEEWAAEFVNLDELSVSKKIVREIERKLFALTRQNP